MSKTWFIVGSVNRVITPAVVILPTAPCDPVGPQLLLANHRLPSGPAVIPTGQIWVFWNMLNDPPVVSRPMMSPSVVNHKALSGPTAMSLGVTPLNPDGRR